ncbi:MAG: hypothetical protein ACI8SE_001295 [Bacteroidia bacterium]|jgi:hypothetical protein
MSYKNQVIYLEDKNRKVIGFTDNEIIISSKAHKTFDSLRASSEKSGMLETVTNIPNGSLKEITYNEKADNFFLKYEIGGKVKKVSIAQSESETREAVIDEIAALHKLTKSVQEESKTKPLLLNSIGIVIVPIATWIFRGMALDAQNGQHYQAEGRRSGVKQLIGNAVEALGPTGVTVLGIVVLGYMVYRTYKRFSNPASVIQYT